MKNIKNGMIQLSHNGNNIVNKIKAFMLPLMLFCIQPIPVQAYTISTSTNFMAAFEQFKSQYSIFITIFMSIMTLTSIAIFIYHCLMLAASSDNAQKRAEAIKNLLITGCCFSAQSAISLIIALVFWGFYI